MSGEVFWIKLQTGTFDSETIMLLESMPEGDTILIIWFKMQILAGKCNAGGYLLLNGESPYSDEMLSTVFRRQLNTVRLAISAFLQFKMIEIINGAYFLIEWEKHQNVSGLDKIKEQTRQRVAKYRAKLKDVTLPVTQDNGTEQETEQEIEPTTNKVRVLLVGTPLANLTDQELRLLEKRHGVEKLMLAADISAETWRRKPEHIGNPGGYLNSLCRTSLVPKWFTPYKERIARAEATRQHQAAVDAEMAALKVQEEAETAARDAYWQSLSKEEQERFNTAILAESPFLAQLPVAAILATAKLRAWEASQAK
jgi:predicted phage replisome organizer